jgi:hypothetical protein
MGNIKSARYRAWRNLCVAAINAGIEQRIFGTEPWDGPNSEPGGNDRRAVYYRFPMCGRTVKASAADNGYNEIRLLIGLGDGDALAYCDFERRKGAWIQTGQGGQGCTGAFRCKRAWLSVLAGLKIEPNGYADNGQWFF